MSRVVETGGTLCRSRTARLNTLFEGPWRTFLTDHLLEGHLELHRVLHLEQKLGKTPQPNPVLLESLLVEIVARKPILLDSLLHQGVAPVLVENLDGRLVDAGKTCNGVGVKIGQKVPDDQFR